MWQRFMTRLLAETKITERFTDLRGKVGSDAECQSGMAQCNPLGAHHGRVT